VLGKEKPKFSHYALLVLCSLILCVSCSNENLREVAQTDVRVSREPTGIHLEFAGFQEIGGVGDEAEEKALES
jgi:hypothetical protein